MTPKSEQHEEAVKHCPNCGSEMDRKKLTGATRCAGELRKSVTVKDFCDCGIRIRVNKEIGEPI